MQENQQNKANGNEQLRIFKIQFSILQASDSVLSKSYTSVQQAILHIVATIICSVVGIFFLAVKPQVKMPVKSQNH